MIPLADQTVHCVVTSPPYFGLRVYADNDERGIGAETSVEEYIANMVSKEQRRVNAWQQGLADVIDEGHDLNLPDNVLAPLRASSQAMTENLLTVAE